MVLCSIGAMVNKMNTGSLCAMLLCLASLLYNVLYALQAFTGKTQSRQNLNMAWHIHAQHLQLQHVFVLTFAAAINIDQLIFSTMGKGFMDLVAALSPTAIVLVIWFLAAYGAYFCIITALVNLHSSVQTKLEYWIEVKIKLAEKNMDEQ